MTDTRTKDQIIEDMAKVVSKYRYPLTAEECKRIAQAAYAASGVEALRVENEKLRSMLIKTELWIKDRSGGGNACFRDEIKQALGETL